MGLGWTYESKGMSRGQLVDGRSGSPRTAAMALRAAVLAPGCRDEGWNGCRFRPIWRKSRISAIFFVLGRRGSRAAGERCPALLGLPKFFFVFSTGVTGSRLALPGPTWPARK
ncbi:hypothetical protein CRG98_008455 [Punica granatum]|uniref:Uncharacterized protein n=1 Tax=Punica granatum TaxID=22663 RepID=A0A2I0KRP8_PUNGR|nr:hypothetical protein CRG98_008455 [Punica granatum]